MSKDSLDPGLDEQQRAADAFVAAGSFSELADKGSAGGDRLVSGLEPFSADSPQCDQVVGEESFEAMQRVAEGDPRYTVDVLSDELGKEYLTDTFNAQGRQIRAKLPTDHRIVRITRGSDENGELIGMGDFYTQLQEQIESEQTK